jgi:6-phosphofructokinase 1
MVAEVMGHNTGWLTLGSGLAGGADAILIPEIPYRVESVAESIVQRKAAGSNFSIVAVAEGAMPETERSRHDELQELIDDTDDPEVEARAEAELAELHQRSRRSTEVLAEELEQLTGLEARVTILGHVQRGGIPSPMDRLLATRLGTAAADAVASGELGIMIASRDGKAESVPLEEVAGRRKTIPFDHPWIISARNLGICLGD